MARKKTNLNIMGVYSITNLIDGKVYIGKAKNIRIRWNTHKRELNNGTHINRHLQNAWNKYGSKSFKFEIIYNPIDDEDMLTNEERLIKQYGAINRDFGYNLTTGGESGVLSKESMIKVSNSKIGMYNDLTKEDIRQIKIMAYCFMDKREITKIFNVNVTTITNIITGVTYSHIMSELNPYIKNVKQQIVDDRNIKILEFYDKGYKIYEIRDILSLTNSIVEKCIYKYRGSDNEKSITTEEEKDNIINLYFKQNFSTIEINKLLHISKPRVLAVINDYKRDVLGTLSDESLLGVSSFCM